LFWFLVRIILGLFMAIMGLESTILSPSGRCLAFMAGGLLIMDGVGNFFRDMN
jgi:hypothetical protein